MNKWQLICLLVAMSVFGLAFAMITGARDQRYYLRAQTQLIGQDLIASTNSERLVQLDSGMPRRLSLFLRSFGGVAEVKLGDEPSPIGDGTASSRLILSNAAGERLGIRLRPDAELEKFHVLGFWTVTEPGGPATGSQPIRAK